MSYLDLHYSKIESDESDYPQQLCDYLIAKYLSDCKSIRPFLLDIGSGRGNYVSAFERRNFEAFGVDKRAEDIGDYRKEAQRIFTCDLDKERLPFKDDMFDVVFSKSVIEHIYSTEHMLQEIYRVLTPGGTVVLMTPAWESQYRHFFDDHTHIKPFTRKGLQNALLLNNFSNVNCTYFTQLPILWRYPFFKVVVFMCSFFPDGMKWRDSFSKEHRKLIRFSKEKMLLAVAKKDGKL